MRREKAVIYYEGLLGSLVEFAYIEDTTLSEKVSNCTIFVDPVVIDYLSTKLVIITDTNYPTEKVNKLLKRNCEVVARVGNNWPEGVKIVPYKIRVSMKIVWNGITMRKVESLSELVEDGVSLDNNTLLFPKIEESPLLITKDNNGRLTPLGWALHQVGQDQETGEIGDLDIIKTLKMIPE